MLDLPKAEKVKKRKFSSVWLLPVLALMITGWLIYNGYIDTGKEITVQFGSGAGIVVGKTPLQYKGINIGRVVGFEAADTLEKVNVVIRLDKRAASFAKKGMMFWLVKPQLSIDRVTGLETILSGTYIEVQPPTYDMKQLEQLKDEDFFIASPEAPRYLFTEGVLSVNLLSDKDPKLFRGMGVFFNSSEAGKVASVTYDEKQNDYKITLAIKSKYKNRINAGTKFWNISGLDVKLDSAGFSFKAPPLAGIFQGGVAFASDYYGNGESPLKVYQLYSSYSETMLCDREIKLTMPDSYGIRAKRTPVMYKGMRVGMVTGVGFTGNNKKIMAVIKMNKGFEGLVRENTRFVIGRPEVSLKGVKNLASVVTGVFIQVVPGSGKLADDFTLYQKPIVAQEEGDIPLMIRAQDTGSLSIGSGIYYKGVQIGALTKSRLDGGSVLFDAVIRSPYKSLASNGLYLWEASPLSVKLSGEELSVKTNLEKAVSGGVNAGFFTGVKRTPLKAGTVLRLYKSEDSAKEAYIRANGVKKIFLAAPDGAGVTKGAPVVYKGVQVGEIGNRFLNKTTGRISVSAMIYPKYRALLNGRTYFWKLGEASVSFDKGELRVETPQVSSIISGGVAFMNDAPGATGETGRNIYPSRASARMGMKWLFAGKRVRIYSDKLSFPPAGAPVTFRGAQAGEIYDTGYDRVKGMAFGDILISKDFADTVGDTSRFWKGGNIEIRAAGNGLSVHSEPLADYVKGSLAYDSFVKPGGTDMLYAGRKAAGVPDMTRVHLVMKKAYGIKNNAPVICEGMGIGYVKSVRRDGAEFTAELMIDDESADYMRQGAVFHLAGVDISLSGIKNADSALFGPKLVVYPGTGARENTFALSDEPVSPYYGLKGLHIILTADAADSLETGSPVYYRQVQTGAVEWVRLTKDGSRVEIGVFIYDRDRNLVRKDSVFTSISGVDAGFGFFSGFRLRTQSVKSVFKGGVSFTTKSMKSPPAAEGAKFELTDN